MAKVTFTHAGDTLIAYLAGEIDHHTAETILDAHHRLLIAPAMIK